MAKGLAIARAFYKEGHTVIGADFEPYFVPVSGHFSCALKRFYRLPSPPNYIEALLNVIEREEVDIWISCSGVASAAEDGRAAEAVRSRTSCQAVQFGLELTETLHEKHSFIDNTKKLGLNVPETQLVESVKDAMDFLYQKQQDKQKKNFILKSVGMDDSVRADMTLLQKATFTETEKHIAKARPSKTRPFVLQQFINGAEYCTHSIVIRGKVVAFTSCKSAGILMHYRALSQNSELNQAMLKYTQAYAEKTGEQMTGHFSMDFLVDDHSTGDISQRIYPIECNPRAHTAVILFENDSAKMVKAYLSVLSKDSMPTELCTTSSTRGYYWIGHDIVEYGVFPLWAWLTLAISFREFLRSVQILAEHILFQREGTFTSWDPWPAWWLYCGYWPAMFVISLVSRDWWSQCNVSTNKIFRC
jgi:hypothetical protein